VQYFRDRWNTQLECEGALSQNKISKEFGEDTTPGYVVMNIRGGYTFPKQNIILNGGIENVLDAYYHTHLDWGNIPRPGRNLYLSLALTF
jgi:iron complex outermembrane receptor protein